MLEQMAISGVARWKSPDGDLRIWRPAPHVLLTRFEGRYYSLDFARRTMDAIEESAAGQPPPDIFHDWEGMEAYATESRTQMTEQARRLLRQVNSFTVLTRSKLVRMGVSMANLVLGGRIQAVTERGEFERALDQAVSRFQVARGA